MAEGMPARMELIHPEGRTVLDSPAHVHITDERIDVVQERGAPLLISVLTIREAEVVGDAVPLVLDSDYTVRLSRLEDPNGLLKRIAATRRERLGAALHLPGRRAVGAVTATIAWSERGRVPLVDRGLLIADSTHIIVVPDRHQPFSLPLWSLREVEPSPGGALRLASSIEGLSIEFVDTDPTVDHVVQAILDGRANAEQLVSVLLPTDLPAQAALCLVRQPCLRAGDPESAGVDMAELAQALASEARRRPLSLLASLAEADGLRVGVTVNEEKGELGATAWCMAICRSRGLGPGIVVATPLSDTGVATIVFRRPTGSEDLVAEDPATLWLHLERACSDTVPDFTPLGLPESEMAEVRGGLWLWPIHQFGHLREARRRARYLIPLSDPEDWSRDLLQVLASG